MKYLRGYIVAAVLAAFTVAITLFAANHQALVDMVYPYLTRMVQTTLSAWSAATPVLLWQIFAVLLVVGLLASIVVMIVLRWNFFQWLGWVLTGVVLLWTLHTGTYGLNNYAGPLSDDIRLKVTGHLITEKAMATTYFRDEVNRLSKEVPRDASGHLDFPEFDELAEMAANGFDNLTYKQHLAVFAGAREPVKELGWTEMYSSMGILGLTMPLTGEAAVNPTIPDSVMPFTMCHEMSHRICIASERDANMAAFLACRANDSVIFRYSGYFMAFRYCYAALASDPNSTARNVAREIYQGLDQQVLRDIADYQVWLDANVGESASGFANLVNDTYIKVSGDEAGTESYAQVSDLLFSWYIQEIYMPDHQEEEPVFDPTDRNQVDLGDKDGQ